MGRGEGREREGRDGGQAKKNAAARVVAEGGEGRGSQGIRERAGEREGEAWAARRCSSKCSKCGWGWWGE
jgi:hypothetical protein